MAKHRRGNCSVDGCGRRHHARGYCSAHYDRFRAYGDVDAGIPIGEARASLENAGECGVADCTLPAVVRGYCRPHYLRARSGGEFTSKLCAVPTCTRKIHTRGYCHAHYMRFYTHGDVMADVPLRRWQRYEGCSIEGCERLHAARGLCAKHYNQARLREKRAQQLTGGPNG